MAALSGPDFGMTVTSAALPSGFGCGGRHEGDVGQLRDLLGGLVAVAAASVALDQHDAAGR